MIQEVASVACELRFPARRGEAPARPASSVPCPARADVPFLPKFRRPAALIRSWLTAFISAPPQSGIFISSRGYRLNSLTVPPDGGARKDVLP